MTRNQHIVAIRDLARVDGLPASEAEVRAAVVREFEFRITPYYAGLINWSDPKDPLRLIIEDYLIIDLGCLLRAVELAQRGGR